MSERDPRDSEPEQPRHEPEIIPPGQRGRRDSSHIFVSIDEHGGTRRLFMARPGPFTTILVLAVIGLIGLVALIVLLSVALIWIPVVIALVAAFVASMTFRHWWRRFQVWWARR
jgi:hypothetical protein